MTRNIQLAPSEFYHIYNRGTEKRDVFLDIKDYDRFLSLLYIANNTERVDVRAQGKTLKAICAKNRKGVLVEIASYCLMPNHFHLLVKTTTEHVSLGKFMQKLITAYSMYFNKKYKRSGALFQGRYKAKHVDTDEYLKYLLAYIHLNPLSLIEPNWKEKQIWERGEGKQFLHSYEYSSFLDFTGSQRDQRKIIQKEELPQYFTTPDDFLIYVNEWIDFNAPTITKVKPL